MGVPSLHVPLDRCCGVFSSANWRLVPPCSAAVRSASHTFQQKFQSSTFAVPLDPAHTPCPEDNAGSPWRSVTVRTMSFWSIGMCPRRAKMTLQLRSAPSGLAITPSEPEWHSMSAADGFLRGDRFDQPEDHAQRGGLPCAVRSEEAGDGTGGDIEAQVVDGDDVAEALREMANGDGAHRSVTRARMSSTIGSRKAWSTLEPFTVSVFMNTTTESDSSGKWTTTE